MNEERYNRYLVDKEFTWKSRFIWNGLEGDMPKNSIGIATFEKETKLFRRMAVCKNTNEFYKQVDTIAKGYVKWVDSKGNYDEDEKTDLINFFKGSIGEYFFSLLLDNVKCMDIRNQKSNKIQRFDFNKICPLLPGEDDYGIDLTGKVSDKDGNYYDVAIQVKFWNPNNDRVITNAIAAGAYTDAVLNKFIDADENSNIVICWLGNTKKVSKWLKNNKKLYKHILFVDNGVLDYCINNKMPQFWNMLHDELTNIRNF